jgi:ribosome maturation protein SDO1
LPKRNLSWQFTRTKFNPTEPKCKRNVKFREKDLNEVLQTDKIYTDVGKGELAKKKELDEHFKTMTNEEIIKLILDKGEIQVSGLERDQNFTNIKNEIANIIVEKTFDIDTGLKYSQQMIVQALDDVNFVAKNDKPTKAQALAAIKLIQEKKALNMERKFLEIQITIKDNKFKGETEEELLSLEEMKVKFLQFLADIESKFVSQNLEPKTFKIIADIKPNHYRDLLAKFEDFYSIEIISNSKIIKSESQTIKEEEVKTHKKEEKRYDMKISNQYIEKVLGDDGDDAPKDVEKEKIKKSMKCTKCKNCVVADQDELRKHYKSEWHNFNVRRISKGEPSLECEEYIDQIHLNKNEK